MQWNGVFPFEFEAKSMETKTTAWLEFPKEGKGNVKQTLALEEINKSTRAGLWKSQSVLRVGKLIIWGRSFKRNYKSSAGLSFAPEWVSQSLLWILKSAKTYKLADGLINRTTLR